MSDATISLVILAVVIVLFVWNRLPVGVVAILTTLSLYATGVLDVSTALAGFGDPVVIFIATLFVVSEGIDSTGVTTWAGQALTERAGTGRTQLTIAVMALCAVATALITPNGSVAALLPMVVVLAMRIRTPPAQMLLPLAFGAHAGSLLMLTGSPVNVIVSDYAVEAGGRSFGFFEYALIGLPLLAVTIIIACVLGPRVLPSARSKTVPPDLSRYASTMTERYGLRDGFYRLRVSDRSPLLGIAPHDVDLSAYPGVTLIGLQAAIDEPAPVRSQLDPDDVLVVTGPADQINQIVMDHELTVTMHPSETTEDALLTKEMGVVEVVVPPRSPLVGEVAFPGMARTPDLVVLAIKRLGKDTGPREVVLAEGDALLMHGTWPAIDGLVGDRSILLVDAPDIIRRQAVPMGPRAKQAVGVLAGMVLLLALGVVPPAIAGLMAATAMVLLRVVSPKQAYAAVSWQTVVLIGGLIPLSTAIQESGAADLIAGLLIQAVGTGQPYLLLAALFLLTGILGQVISNTATVLIVAPIAVSAALETGVAVQPVLMLIAVAGAASFLTPIATPANMMVMGPAGYKFNDYWKLGLPTMVAWLAVALLVIPLIWPF